MNKLAIRFLKSAILLGGVASAANAAPLPKCFKGEPLGRMRKVQPASKWTSPELPESGRKKSASASTPKSDSFQYLYGPDGTEWYAVCEYDTELIPLEGGYANETLIKGFEFTIYDNLFNEIGKVKDTIKLEEGETKCAQVMLDVTVTKKFFNYDNNYEVMVSLCMNRPDYEVNIRTNVYAINSSGNGQTDTPLKVIDGYPVDAVDTAKDPWTEDFYITFLTERHPDLDKDYEEYIDYLAGFYQVLTTYTKATTTSEASVLTVHEIPWLNLPGDQMSSPMMLCKNQDGMLTLAYAQYEKSLFIDPSGMGENEDLTPDNNLIIDVYQLDNGYPRQLQHISSTKLPTTQKDDPNVYYTFYGIGTLGYDKDVDFTHYTTDGRPAFVITVDDYLLDDDDNYNSSYYVYDADGNKLKTIAENTFNFVYLSDLPGYEPQVMFIHAGDEMVFEFVDLYSCKSVLRVDQMYRGYALTTSIDRVPTADSYAYAIAVGQGLMDENENILAPVCWINRKGEPIRVDAIPMGEGVEMVQIYISKNALSPYVFNTDDKIEYMILAKRRVDSYSEGLREEFLIATAQDGVIRTFLPEEGKGDINIVYLMGEQHPQLIIAYKEDYKFTADLYELPFSMFAGGKGTEKEPYLIATAGDFLQIGKDPNAFYRLTSDLDFGGVEIPSVEDFSGSLDGKGFTMSNVTLRSDRKTGLFYNTTYATFRNLNFYNANLHLSGDGDAGLLSGISIESTFDNIHVREMNVDGDDFGGAFGGIAGRAWTRSKISECEVSGAEINLPSGRSTGGIVAEIRTGVNINACVFAGSIHAHSTVGGIVAETTTGDEIISNCHVDADLKARNTVGGIVGFLDRSKVTTNYVEGTIEVTEPNKWTNALAAGAIAGELEGDWEKKANVPVVNNLIGVTTITYPELNIQEAYPHQLATVHRVVGRSCYNAEPEISGYDADENPIYKDEVRYEEGIYNNYVVSDLPVIEAEFDGKTLEGTTIDKKDVDTSFLKENLGFIYGTSASEPWNIRASEAYDPSIHYESTVWIPYSLKTVLKGDKFYIEVAILSRESVSEEEVLGSLSCKFKDTLIEETGDNSFDGHTLRIGFRAKSEGSAKVTVTVLDATASCYIEVVTEQSSVSEVFEEAIKPVIKEGRVIAEGCTISIYSLDGKRVAYGKESVDVNSLGKGTFIAVTENSMGNRASIKFMR